MSARRRPRWPWGIGLDKRQARRLRRRAAGRPLYVSAGRRILKSTDEGRTWTELDPVACCDDECVTEEHGNG